MIFSRGRIMADNLPAAIFEDEMMSGLKPDIKIHRFIGRGCWGRFPLSQDGNTVQGTCANHLSGWLSKFCLLNHDLGEDVTGRELVISGKDVFPDLGGIHLAESPVLIIL